MVEKEPEQPRSESKLSQKSVASRKSVKSVASASAATSSLADMSLNSASRGAFQSGESEDDSSTIRGSEDEGSAHSEAKSVAKSESDSAHSMLQRLAETVSRKSSAASSKSNAEQKLHVEVGLS